MAEDQGKPVTLRRRFGRLLRTAADASWLFFNTAFAATLASAIVVNPINDAVLPFAFTAIATLLVLPARSAWAAYRQRLLRGKLELKSSALVFDGGKYTLPFAKVVGVLRNDGSLWLMMRDETLWELKGLDAETERAIEEALPSTPTFEIRTPARRGAKAALIFYVLALAASIVMALSGIFLDKAVPLSIYGGVVIAGWLAQRIKSGRVRMGVDGVRIDAEYISYDDLLQVTSSKGLLAIALKSGETKEYNIKVGDEVAKALDLLAHSGIDAPESDGEVFDRRAEESVSDWLKRVRRIFDETHYREGVTSKERASALLKAPKTPPRVRVGVAAALAPTDPEQVEEALLSLADARTVRLARHAIADSYDELDELSK